MPAIVAWIVGTVLAGLGMAVVAWALFADAMNPYRPRRRCPRCWHDLGQVQGLRCPECGHEARGEAALKRARRRWRWAGVGVVLVILGPLASFVPTMPIARIARLLPVSVLRACELLPDKHRWRLVAEREIELRPVRDVTEVDWETLDQQLAAAITKDQERQKQVPRLLIERHWAENHRKLPRAAHAFKQLAMDPSTSGRSWAEDQIQAALMADSEYLEAVVDEAAVDAWREVGHETRGSYSAEGSSLRRNLLVDMPAIVWPVLLKKLEPDSAQCDMIAAIPEWLNYPKPRENVPISTLQNWIASEFRNTRVLGLRLAASRERELDSGSIQLVGGLLRDDSREVRRLAKDRLDSLLSVRMSELEHQIIAALGDPHAEVRRDASSALWHNACQLSPAGLRTLIAATDDPVAANALYIRLLLQNCRSVEIEDALCDAMGDDRPAVEYTAVEALVDRGSWLVLPSTLDRLAEVSNDPRRSALVRELATRALLNYAKQRFGLEY